MEQLVGLRCIHCGKSVDSILDGRFCEGCGNPRHNKCRKPATDQPELCGVCGGAKNNPYAKEAGVSQFTSILKSGPDETKEPGPFPVSKACPSCGRTEFFKIRPNQLVAFMYDRVCTYCRTRYTPPTPVWAGVVFLLMGFLLAGFGGLSIFLHLASGNPLGIPAMTCEGFVGVLGLLSLAHGLRVLYEPGRN